MMQRAEAAWAVLSGVFGLGLAWSEDLYGDIELLLQSELGRKVHYL